MHATPGHLRATALAALLVFGVAAPVAAQGVQFVVAPATLNLAPDSTFMVELQVPVAGSAFNAFDAVVEFDTTAVTVLPMSPIALQEGSLITGASCGTPFHVFTYMPGADSMSISLAIICAHTSVTGPGQLYKLRFRSRSGSHDSWIRIRSCTFYSAGYYVTPVVTADAHVIVTDATGVPRQGPAGAVLRVRADPNPARGMVRLTLEGRGEGVQRLEIHDVLGRSVRTIALENGTASAHWDGRNSAGSPMPPGLYLVTWRSRDALARGLVTMLH